MDTRSPTDESVSMTTTTTTIQLNISMLPDEMMFGDVNFMSIVVYTVLFIVSAIGNLTVFCALVIELRRRQRERRRSRVLRFILHLSMADLFVTFVMMPLEIVWNMTVSWKAGDTACRLLMFCRAFGIYLSSFVLIAISLDRYFAIAQPLQLQTADRRGRIMLSAAWVFSALASAPQSVIFHVEVHPVFLEFSQCVTFNFFPSPTVEIAYNLFNMAAIYILPLFIIIVTYSLILIVISKKTRRNRLTSAKKICSADNEIPEGLRSTGDAQIEKAKTRTLRMTIVIVTVFVICWTPYFVISALWWFDKDSAAQIDRKIQKGLFAFAVSNSCVNPIVYGVFSTIFRCATSKTRVNMMSSVPVGSSM